MGRRVRCLEVLALSEMHRNSLPVSFEESPSRVSVEFGNCGDEVGRVHRALHKMENVGVQQGVSGQGKVGRLELAG